MAPADLWLLALSGTRASGGMADALASGASARKGVGVQVPPRAHFSHRLVNTPEWIQAVVATAGISGGFKSSSLSFSFGVWNPRVLRGRLFSWRAACSRSSRV